MSNGLDFNFISKDMTKEDLNLFFSPIEPMDTFITIQDDWTMADIMVQVGVFQSKTQAKKNGWDKPIPKRFSDMRVTKRKIRVTIWGGWEIGDLECIQK